MPSKQIDPPVVAAGQGSLPVVAESFQFIPVVHFRDTRVAPVQGASVVEVIGGEISVSQQDIGAAAVGFAPGAIAPQDVSPAQTGCGRRPDADGGPDEFTAADRIVGNRIVHHQKGLPLGNLDAAHLTADQRDIQTVVIVGPGNRFVPDKERPASLCVHLHGSEALPLGLQMPVIHVQFQRSAGVHPGQIYLSLAGVASRDGLVEHIDVLTMAGILHRHRGIHVAADHVIIPGLGDDGGCNRYFIRGCLGRKHLAEKNE